MNSEQALETDLDVSFFELEYMEPSLIYNVLPTVVQNRIPPIPSLRRAISDMRARKGGFGVNAESIPDSPPPNYTTNPSSAVSRSGENSNRSSVVFSDGDTSANDGYFGHLGHLGSEYNTPPVFSISERRTGINWKYAKQGMPETLRTHDATDDPKGVSLSMQAHSESHILARNYDETSASLTRQLYIHGLAYMLRGLPVDLTSEETVSLQAAIPESLVHIQDVPCTHTEATPTQKPNAQRFPYHASLLHRITAVLVFQAFVLIRFLVPYITVFVAHAYQFEKEHKVTQRLVNNGILTAEFLRCKTLHLSRTVCQLNDGKIGRALFDLTLRCVEGLTGGLQQGIEEGFEIMAKGR
jgi:hypothetical protein